jgi:hypothetical protein
MKSFRTNIKNFLLLPLSTLNADLKITELLTNSSAMATSLQIIVCIKENVLMN